MATCTWPQGCESESTNKKTGYCSKHYQVWYRDEKRKQKLASQIKLPSNLGDQISKAKTTEEWQKLAATVAPVMQAILDGTRNGNAAQVSLMKSILDRAYGKPVATQADKKVAAGLVILPVLGTGETMTVCPRCAYDQLSQMDKSSIKTQLTALLESIKD